MSGKQLIVLTVPHYVCDDGIEHPCDNYAAKLAETITDSIKSNSRDIVIQYGDIPRKITDLNRNKYSSISSNFRRKIRNLIEEKIKSIQINQVNQVNHEEIIYLIDCHSFPGKSFANVRFENPDVSILMADCRQLTLVEELTDSLKEKGIKATKHLGKGNSIIEEFYFPDKTDGTQRAPIPERTQRAPIPERTRIIPILIEANENEDYNMKIVAECVNVWIEKINKFVSNSN